MSGRYLAQLSQQLLPVLHISKVWFVGAEHAPDRIEWAGNFGSVDVDLHRENLSSGSCSLWLAEQVGFEMRQLECLQTIDNQTRIELGPRRTGVGVIRTEERLHFLFAQLLVAVGDEFHVVDE